MLSLPLFSLCLISTFVSSALTFAVLAIDGYCGGMLSLPVSPLFSLPLFYLRLFCPHLAINIKKRAWFMMYCGGMLSLSLSPVSPPFYLRLLCPHPCRPCHQHQEESVVRDGYCGGMISPPSLPLSPFLHSLVIFYAITCNRLQEESVLHDGYCGSLSSLPHPPLLSL